MGIKENFTKALRELTGGGDKEADNKTLSEEDLEKAVEAYSNQRMLEIAQNVEELEKAVDAYGAAPQVARETTPRPNVGSILSLDASVKANEAAATPRDPAPAIVPSPVVSPVIAEPVKEPAAVPAAPAIAEASKSVEIPPVIAEPVKEPPVEPAVQTSVEISKSVDAPPVIEEPVKEPAVEPAAQTIAETPKSADVPPVIAEPVREPVAEPAVSKTSETSERSGGFAGMGGFRAANASAGTDRPAGSYAAPSAFTGFNQRNDTDDANEITIISRNTIIDGNIRSFADMSINGDIRGDVETTKNIELNGKIVGNIICNNAFMHRSQIQGGIRMKGSLSMKRDTLLIGDLAATFAEINGKIKGNIDVAGRADLKADAVVFGDINASTITVEDGAVIQGRVDTVSMTKDGGKDLFPDIVVIGEGY